MSDDDNVIYNIQKLTYEEMWSVATSLSIHVEEKDSDDVVVKYADALIETAKGHIEADQAT